MPATKKKPSTRKGEFKKLPFLKADDLPSSGTIEMTVIGNTRSFNGDYGLKLNMNVRVGKKDYAFGIKPNNPGLRTIIDRLAAGEVIEIQRGEYNGNEYVQVVGDDDEAF